ncbi:hypothetical protein F4801DRAFT_458000 [Xylaria longipes]|nr:hypothetical protein F4801DRAFT_458000 [Xylaria longipes]
MRHISIQVSFCRLFQTCLGIVCCTAQRNALPSSAVRCDAPHHTTGAAASTYTFRTLEIKISGWWWWPACLLAGVVCHQYGVICALISLLRRHSRQHGCSKRRMVRERERKRGITGFSPLLFLTR